MSQLSVAGADSRAEAGFTLVELLVVVAIVAVLAAIAVPAFSALYSRCCLASSTSQLHGLLLDGRRRSLEGEDHAIIFDTARHFARLVSGRGADGTWNTADDPVVRTVSLPASVRFGYGPWGPLPGLAQAPDGVSFQNNILVCNTELTGSAGTVYLITSAGNAMALRLNSSEISATLHRWDGSSWCRH
jgi:prepilin-type N-terminal cleavage/methylation domain-containing protein